MSNTLKMDILGMTAYDDFVEKFKPKKTAAAQALVFALSPREQALVEMLGKMENEAD